MKFLPIVERELRVASRRWGTYWLRAWVALIVGVVGTAIVTANLEEPPQTVAFYLFHSIAGGALLYCIVIGARTTADCLSEEKRDGTLGLLFLTDLKGYDVVFGKLVANSLNAFYGLLSVIPMVGVPLLMGGITGYQVVCAAVVLVNTMFLSVSAGICASACFRSAPKAIGATLAVVLLLTMGIPGLGFVLFWTNRLPMVNTDFFLTSPIFSYVAPQDFVFWRRNLPMFIQSIAVIQGVGWGLLFVACFVVKRSWQDRPAGRMRLRWRERWKQWSYGGAVERKEFRTRLLEENAFFWLAARDRLKPAWVWGTLGLLFCAWCWGADRFQDDWLNPPVYAVTAFLINSVLKNWFASEATRQLSEERRAGSLELLLATPLRLEEIFHGQWLALRRQFFWPILIVLVAETWMFAAGYRGTNDQTDRRMWLAWWVVGMASLVTDFIALFWVGMWLGLASKQPKRAYSDTVGRVLALPWVIFICFAFCVLFSSLRGSISVRWEAYPGTWFVIGLGASFGYGLWARTNLYTRFREAATWRYQTRSSFWQRVSGKAHIREGEQKAR